MNNATITETLRHAARVKVKMPSCGFCGREFDPGAGSEYCNGCRDERLAAAAASFRETPSRDLDDSILDFAAYSPTGAVDGDTEREPTKQEREVQAWRDSGGKADGPKPTGRMRLCWNWPGGNVQREAWESFGSSRVRGENLPSRVERWWIEYEYTATTPNAGNPAEHVSLPESGAIGQECGKVSGERETAAESGEISELRFRLKIAEDGWTRARFDTDAMTREIEGLREVVEAARRLKNGMKSDYATNQHAPIYDHRQALADLILAFGRLKGEEVAG